ncbi:MAG: ABC transport system, permease [Candidatus Hecatellales archaeon B24]|nr:MAG: ABC transport system, permease [Candidatus Hecatellales archaeon B24]
MGLPFRSFGTSVWLGLKYFKIAWFKVKLGILALSMVTASFIFFTGFRGFERYLTFIPVSIIMAVAFSAVMLHLVKWSIQDVALFKALGANRGTITLAVLFELTILGLLSSAIGVAVGLALVFPLQGIEVFQSAGALTLTAVLLSVLLGALTGALSVWRESKRTVAEILSYAG